MIEFANLRAVQAYKERRAFLLRRWTRSRVGLLCFTAGALFVFFVVTVVHIATR